MTNRTLVSTAIVVLGLFANSAHAQFTNVLSFVPATKLEAFDTNVEVVILKGSTEVGAITADAGSIAVKCREITDTSNGHASRPGGTGVRQAMKRAVEQGLA